jgi:hypothetical protein
MTMPRYLISFDAHAMDHVPKRTFLPWAEQPTRWSRRRWTPGVWVFGGGLRDQKASVAAADGTVNEGHYPGAIGGMSIVDVPTREEALEWGAKIAAACRCPQEVLEFGPEPMVGN